MRKIAEPSFNAVLPEVQDVVQDDEHLGNVEEGYFFRGFKKRAAEAMTGQRSGFSAALGPRAKSGVTTVPAFKPQPVPSPTPAPARHNLAAVPKTDPLKAPTTARAKHTLPKPVL